LSWLIRYWIVCPNHGNPVNPIIEFCFIARFVMKPLLFEKSIVIMTHVPVDPENPVILSNKNEKSLDVTCFIDS